MFQISGTDGKPEIGHRVFRIRPIPTCSVTRTKFGDRLEFHFSCDLFVADGISFWNSLRYPRVHVNGVGAVFESVLLSCLARLALKASPDIIFVDAHRPAVLENGPDPSTITVSGSYSDIRDRGAIEWEDACRNS